MEHVDFKFLLIMLSKVIKSIGRWVINTLKCEKESGKVFYCDNIAEIKREIFGISRRYIFIMKKNLLQI